MSLPGGYFDDVYDGEHDPWGFETRWYEQRKRAITLAALPRASYERAFEPGCSIGVLTESLAGRCDELVALDVSPAAVRAAARRTAGLSHVGVSRGSIPADWPAGTFDLIVLSEVLKYLSEPDLAAVASRAVASLRAGGTILSCHWRHTTDYPLSGDRAHELFATGVRDLHRLGGYTDADFRLDLYSPEDASVALVGGLDAGDGA